MHHESATSSQANSRAWVFWDGECRFCRHSISWAVRHDHAGNLRPVPYQRAPSPPMTPRLRRACARAVHVVTPEGQVLRAGRAVLYIFGVCGWPIAARMLSLPPLVWAVEVGYRIVSHNRPFFGRFLLTHEPVDPKKTGELTPEP